jgi:hypothetical protein
MLIYQRTSPRGTGTRSSEQSEPSRRRVARAGVRDEHFGDGRGGAEDGAGHVDMRHVCGAKCRFLRGVPGGDARGYYLGHFVEKTVRVAKGRKRLCTDTS